MADIAAGGNRYMQLRGSRELSKGLRQAGVDLKDLKDVNRRAADVVTPVARSLVPRQSGKLANSIRSGATQKAGVVRAGKKSVPYAGAINYGWPGHHIKPSLFVNRAAKTSEPQWTAVYATAVDKIIERIKGA